MQGRSWLYYILDKMGRSYYIDNGIVMVSASPRPLRYTPSGWEDISIGWERNLERLGNVRNYTNPLEYVIDGAQILRHIIYTLGFEEAVYLLQQKQSLFLDANYYYWYYKFYYKGELDLSTFNDEEDKVTCNIMEGSTSKQLKANEGTTYEITPADVIIKMDGVELRGTKRFVVFEPTYNHGIGLNVKEMLVMQEAISEGIFVNTYFSSSVGSVSDDNYSYVTDDDLSTSEKYNGLVKADVNFIQLHLSGSMMMRPPFSNGRVSQNYILETSTGRIINLFNITHQFSLGPSEVYKFDVVSAPVQLFTDETYFIYQQPTATQNTNNWKYLEDVIFEYITADKYPTTYIKANHFETIHNALVEKITGLTGMAVSSLLAGKKNLVITSGDALRNIPGAVIKTNYNDFFQATNVILNCASGIIKDKIYLETKDFFLKDENVIPLGQVKEVKIRLATELMGNKLKIGYVAKDSDDVNGKQSFNNTSEYSSPIKRIVKEINLVTKYVADPFVIDIYRANLENKKTTDDSKDNDVFVLNIDFPNPQTLTEEANGLPAGTVYYNLKRVAYDVTGGLFSPSTVFNIEELTPARLLEKHANYLNSIFYQFEGNQLVFQTTDKNRDLYTAKDGIDYEEDRNFTIKSTPRLFKPLVFEFEPQTLDKLVELLQDNPNRCFSWIHPNGNTYRGFNLKIGIAADTLEQQTFQLLAVADQDLTTLKNW